MNPVRKLKMDKIRRLSNILKFIFTIMLIVLPVYTALYWVSGSFILGHEHTFNVFLYEGPPLPPIYTLSTNVRILGFLINMIPVTLYMFVLLSLIALFHRFSRGEILSPRIVNSVKHIAWILFAAQILRPIYNFLMSLVLTLQSPPGQRFAYLGITVQDLVMILTSAIALLIYWVFSEYYKLHKEQEFMV